MPSSDLDRLGYLFADIVNSRELDRFDGLLAVEYVNHNAFAEPGVAGVKKVFGAMLAGVPDLRVSAEDVLVSRDGSKVVGRYRYDGTHQGDFMGYAATGAAVALRSIDIWRVEDGRLAEHWDELNTLDLFRQLGALDLRPPQA